MIPSLNKRAGAEVFLINLAKSLAKNNEVFVVLLYDEIDTQIKNELEGSKVKIYSCHKRNSVDLSSAKKLKNIIDSINPNVIHMHLNCILSFYFAFGFKKLSFKLYLTVHSLIQKDYRKLERCLIHKYVKRNLLSLIGISDLITKNVCLELKINRIETIYNGTELFSPIINEKDENNQINIVCVAAFRKEKNQSLLLSAFMNLQEHTSKNLKLFFVGEGPLLEQVKNEVKDEFKSKVIFTGHRNDVYEYLSNSHIFCLSSVYEGNPISIIEAMSVGLPVIAPNVGGIPDVVNNGTNGLLFVPEDKKDLESKLSTMINNIDLRKIIRKNNIADSKKYSIDICSAQYIKLFSEE